MLNKAIIILISAMTLGSTAQANLMFSPSITYMEQKQDIATVETENKLTMIDLRLGYIMDFGLYLGGLYSIQDMDLLIDSSDSFFGPSVGYYHSGFLIVGTYYLYGEKDLSNGTGKYTQVSGFQLDLSYSIPLTSTVSIGPQISYHSYEFDEIEVSGVAQSTEYSFNAVTPYFNITMMF